MPVLTLDLCGPVSRPPGPGETSDLRMGSEKYQSPELPCNRNTMISLTVITLVIPSHNHQNFLRWRLTMMILHSVTVPRSVLILSDSFSERKYCEIGYTHFQLVRPRPAPTSPIHSLHLVHHIARRILIMNLTNTCHRPCLNIINLLIHQRGTLSSSASFHREIDILITSYSEAKIL